MKSEYIYTYIRVCVCENAQGSWDVLPLCFIFGGYKPTLAQRNEWAGPTYEQVRLRHGDAEIRNKSAPIGRVWAVDPGEGEEYIDGSPAPGKDAFMDAERYLYFREVLI